VSTTQQDKAATWVTSCRSDQRPWGC